VGQTQHPSSGNNNMPMPNCRRIRISKQPEVKMPVRKSEHHKQPNKQKCRWDKTEWRQAKRQSRRNGKLPAATPVEGDQITDNALRDLTRQEMLEKIERVRQDYADLLQEKGDDPTMRALLEAYEGFNQRFIKWENRFLYQIDACASSTDVSYVGEEIAYECGWQIRGFRKKMVLPGTDCAVAIGTVDVPLRIGKQTLGLQLFVSPHIAGYLVLGQDVLSKVRVHDGRLILTFNNSDVVDTRSEDPCGLSFDAAYLYGKDELADDIFKFADDTPETEMHSIDETSEIVKSHTSESGAAPSIMEDLAYIQEEEDLQTNEGVVPRMWSIVTDALPAWSHEDRNKATHIPPFSENERFEDRDREAEEAARTMGEVRFGSAESTDGWMDPFPVSGVTAALTGELANPAPITIQLRRNQPDLPQDLTDGKRNTATAGLMETSELKGNCPLVDCSLDTAEDYLHQMTGNTLAQATGSSGVQAVESISGYQTGRFETQEAGSPEIQTAENSEVATIASSAECTSACVMVYPNSGSVNPPIIIENNNRQLPVMDSDVAEVPGSLERGDHGATVTAGVAGTEQRTRTGHQYTQISRMHEGPVSEELGEISRAFSHLMTTAHVEDSDEQDSFRKLLDRFGDRRRSDFCFLEKWIREWSWISR